MREDSLMMLAICLSSAASIVGYAGMAFGMSGDGSTSWVLDGIAVVLLIVSLVLMAKAGAFR